MIDEIPVSPFQPRVVFQILRILSLNRGKMSSANLQREFPSVPQRPRAFETALQYAHNEGWIVTDQSTDTVSLTSAGRIEERRTSQAAGAIISRIIRKHHNDGAEWALESRILEEWKSVEARHQEHFEAGIDFLQDGGRVDFRSQPLSYALTRRGMIAAQ
jgi:hypothetical protein